jgi:hypothetical protein
MERRGREHPGARWELDGPALQRTEAAVRRLKRMDAGARRLPSLKRIEAGVSSFPKADGGGGSPTAFLEADVGSGVGFA